MELIKKLGRKLLTTLLSTLVAIVKLPYTLPIAIIKWFINSIKAMVATPKLKYASYKTDSDKQHLREFTKNTLKAMCYTVIGSMVFILNSLNIILFVAVPIVVFSIYLTMAIVSATLFQIALKMSYRKSLRFFSHLNLLIAIPASIYSLLASVSEQAPSIMFFVAISLFYIIRFVATIVAFKIEEKKEELEYEDFDENSFSSTENSVEAKVGLKTKMFYAFIYTLATVFVIFFKIKVIPGGFHAYQHFFG